jgi:hypothetical protein
MAKQTVLKPPRPASTTETSKKPKPCGCDCGCLGRRAAGKK